MIFLGKIKEMHKGNNEKHKRRKVMKVRMKILVVALAVLLFIPMSSGVLAEEQEAKKIDLSDKVVGHSLLGRWALCFIVGEKYLKETFDKYGIRVITAVAENDVVKQAQDIDDFIARGVDAIVCVNIDSKAIVGPMKRAKAAGIPFVTYNRPVDPESDVRPDFFSCQDSFIQAYDAAVALQKVLAEDGVKPEEVKILHILGDLIDENAINRKHGFEKAAKEFGWEIVLEIPSEWNNDKTLPATTNALVAHPEINTLFLASDFLLASVKAAFISQDRWYPRGHPRHIYFASQDINPDAIDEIREGYIDTDTLWDVKGWSILAAEVTVKILRGETPEKKENLMRGVTATTENIDELGSEKIWGMEYVEE